MEENELTFYTYACTDVHKKKTVRFIHIINFSEHFPKKVFKKLHALSKQYWGQIFNIIFTGVP